MRFNPKLKQDVVRYFDYVVIVEGRKDVDSLKSLGFEKVYPVHSTGVSLKESVERIANVLNRKDRVCILTDFDKKGKMLYLKIKSILSEMNGVRLDSSLRGILLKARVSHIEGLDKFFSKVERIK